MQLLSDMTNTQAVERLREGDEAVFTRLYESCYRMVYLQAFKILGQADQAELVVQDVFITVFRTIGSLKDPEALRSWIGGIAVRLALNQRRKLNSSHEFALEEEAMFDLLDAGGASSSPEDALCERDTGLILGELLDQLPEEQRTVMILRYYDECPVKEIAAIMDCAEGTVKSRLNYARKKLEKLILEREKRDGVRLHAVNPALLFLAMFLQEQSLAVSQEAIDRGLLAIQNALGLTATAVSTASTATTATTAAAGGAGGTGASAGGGAAAHMLGGLSAKVIAGITAGVIAVGGITVGAVIIADRQPQSEPEPSLIVEIVSPSPADGLTVLQPTPLPTAEPPEETETPEETQPSEETPAPAETVAPQPSEPPVVPSGQFTIENGVLVAYAGPGGQVTIPGEVTAIGDRVFFGNTDLTSVTIPNGVTAIGIGAFQGCTSLESVALPNSLSSIGTNAFSGTALTNVVIPDSVTSIGSGAFQGCVSLTSAAIGGGVTSMGSGAFYGCTRLASVSIADSVTTLGISTFYGCTSLTGVILPGGVTALDYEVFSGCTGLTDVVIPGSVTSIGYRAFYGCSSLSAVTLPASVTSIDSTAFDGTLWQASQPAD